MEKWERIARESFSKEFEAFKRSLSGGRRPDAVEYTDIETDVKRRDLTINALFYDIDTKEIVDLVGGINDIKNGVVKTVGSPQERFNEDRLRILRAIRFSGRFGSELDPKVDEALRNDSSLEGISGERIRDEFIKGITSAKSVRHFLTLIDRYNLFDWIFRSLKINKNFLDDKDPILVIATLLIANNPPIVAKELNNLKYTVDEIRGITFLLNLTQLKPETAVQLKKMYKISGLSDEQVMKFGLQQGIDNKLLRAFINFTLSVNGDELMKKLNLKPGKELGDAINKAEYINFLNLL
jgi:tRNA nucleotidyltransferase/poly(A) polymerase